MTLTTHIAIAAALTKPLVKLHPAFTFIAALASHYLTDAIPHWDYSLQSLPKEPVTQGRVWQWQSREFWKDCNHIALDATIGIGIAFFALRPDSVVSWTRVALMALGAVLPDFLQGVYFTRRADFLKPVQQWHDQLHSKIKLGPYPWIGVPLQLIILGAALWFL